jgi:hypothetical protein
VLASPNRIGQTGCAHAQLESDAVYAEDLHAPSPFTQLALCTRTKVGHIPDVLAPRGAVATGPIVGLVSSERVGRKGDGPLLGSDLEGRAGGDQRTWEDHLAWNYGGRGN